MAKSDRLDEAAIVDLTDEELKAFLAYHYHSIRNLEQEKKEDEELKRLKEVAKAYEDDNFGEAIKEHQNKIKAGRAIAKARGIHYRLPEVK